ncbi:MAG: ATP-binding protein [Bacteroidota bacterium]
MRLTRKILIAIVPVFLIFITVSVVLQNQFQEREMMEEAQVAAHTYADIVKESLVSMMLKNYEVDSSFIDRVNMLKQIDTLRVFVNNLRIRDELLTPERYLRLQLKYATLRPKDMIEKRVLEGGEPFFEREGEYFRGVIPFTATSVCQKCHAVPVGYALGAADIRISFARVSAATAQNWSRSLIIFVVFAAVVIGVAVMMFRIFVSKPVRGLVGATFQISRGNLDTPVPGAEVLRPGEDELAVLSLRFDEMRISLKEKIDQLDHANRSLSDRNTELERALDRLRKAQEDLVRSERLAVTGKLTAQLSHEINNPIHNIQSLLESALRKVNGNVALRELIGVALEEVSRMAKLTRQMLDFYRGSVVEHEQDEVDLRSLLVETARSYTPQLEQAGITVVLEANEPVPPVRGSRDKLKQVLINLVINARDAMDSGGMLALRCRANRGSVCVEVADTGVGIPEENMGRIFEAFFTTKKEVSGVGLGLAVSYGIVQAHQGTIAVRSTIGKGTTFIIELPASADVHV